MVLSDRCVRLQLHGDGGRIWRYIMVDGPREAGMEGMEEEKWRRVSVGIPLVSVLGGPPRGCRVSSRVIRDFGFSKKILITGH